MASFLLVILPYAEELDVCDQVQCFWPFLLPDLQTTNVQGPDYTFRLDIYLGGHRLSGPQMGRWNYLVLFGQARVEVEPSSVKMKTINGMKIRSRHIC
jgi:hypothetical protein